MTTSDKQSESPTLPQTDAELVVVLSSAGATTRSTSDVGVTELLAEQGATLKPIFSNIVSDDVARSATGTGDANDLSNWFHVLGSQSELEPMADQLRNRPDVEAAYIKPPAEPAVVSVEQSRPDIAREPERQRIDAEPAAPNYSSRQGYLGPSPVGIDTPYAWARSGGKGDGISVIDCEWGWQFNHTDLQQNNLGLVGGTNDSSADHGTAVMGEIGGDHNGYGVNGIAPNAKLGASSVNGQGTAGAIVAAAQNLKAGDLLLIEMHRRGPNGGGGGQQGFIAMEWWPDDFAAIRFAVERGIIVVEAAGNGWENLDDPTYDTPGAGFPASWKNPFRLTNPGSGAVVVGAGSPPAGTHGRSTSPWNLPYVDRARCGFSNWGSRVDAQGWGWEVTTTGYGDLYDAGGVTELYTDTFSGTSSASPIVTGALASTQGVLKAANMPLMDSERARQLLRQTGSPQQAAASRPVSQRIGNRPDLSELIPAALTQEVTVEVLHTFAFNSSKNAWANLKDFGWRRIKADHAEGVHNVFDACVDAQITGKKIRAKIDQHTVHWAWIV